MRVQFNRKFSKQYDKAENKIQLIFDRRLLIFVQNPFHPLLNNHSLTGKFSGYRSINITGDWRAIYKEEINNNLDTVFIFVALGSHSQLYRS